MKERPILFNPENAQKVFEEKKTQTRRVIKPQPVYPFKYLSQVDVDEAPLDMWHGFEAGDGEICEDVEEWFRCPFGTEGNRLWVREAWAEYKEPTPDDDAGSKRASGEFQIRGKEYRRCSAEYPHAIRN